MAEKCKSRHRKFGILILVALVVVGAVTFHRFGGGIDAHADRFVSHIEHELELDRDQSLKLKALKSEIMAIRRDVRDGSGAQVTELAGMLSAPILDQAKLVAMIEDKTRRIDERAPEIVAAIARFTDSLDASQKSILEERIASRIERGDGWRRWRG